MALMRKEIEQKNLSDGEKQLNLSEVFREFVRHRKIKLLRFLFSQNQKFEFTF